MVRRKEEYEMIGILIFMLKGFVVVFVFVGLMIVLFSSMGTLCDLADKAVSILYMKISIELDIIYKNLLDYKMSMKEELESYDKSKK